MAMTLKKQRGASQRPNAHGAAPLHQLLAGGDRRSIAQSEHALALVERSPRRVTELASLAGDADWLVSMRALDLLEKLAHTHPEWIQPHKQVFIGPLADSDKWEHRLQIVRALPLLQWTPREMKRVVAILARDVEHPQKFVSAWALDSLATLAQSQPDLMPLVDRGLKGFETSASKALQTRARHIRTRLGDSHPRSGPRQKPGAV